MNIRLLQFKTLLTLLIAVLGFTLTTYSQKQIGQDIDGEAADDWSGNPVSMPDAYTVAVGAYRNDGNGADAGHVRVYSWISTAWVQKGMDIDGEAVDDRSGASVSMPDANTVAIGAYRNDDNGTDAGHVRVYTWDGTDWLQKGIDIDGEANSDLSGHSVSMPDSNTVAIGALYNDGNGTSSGHVRVYLWNGTAWVQKGIDIDGEGVDDLSGYSVSMPDSNTVAIGAIGNDDNGTNAGQVRIYEWNGTAWAQKGIDLDGEAANDNFGSYVSMPDAYTVAVGAYRNGGNGTDAGHVRIYAWNGTAWVQKGMDIDGEAPNNFSGCSVSMPDDNTVAIGARINDGSSTDEGHVRIYDWNGTAWIQKGMDVDGEAAYDNSGWSVSMPDMSTVAIGAPLNNGSGNASGHVRVYNLKGVQGLVYNDLNQNCTQEEVNVVAGVLGIVQPGNVIVQTQSNGAWYIDSLPIGNYTITYDTTGNWLATCPNPLSFTVTDPNDLTQIPSFGMVNTNPCPEPNISIHMPFMRPGFSDQIIYVEACNDITATGAINNASVIVSLDDSITVDAASMSYTDLGNNNFSFDVGTLNPGECVDLNLSTALSSSAILGQTLCMEAELLPLDSCVLDTVPAPTPPDFTPCSLPWDKSSILVEGECVNDSIIFTITNTGNPGDGDMDCYSPVRLYIDGTYIWLDSIQLNGGDSFTYSFAGDGQTWHLEVDQHPLHPGNSNPNATVELCGNAANWTPDLVNLFPHDDLNPINDIYCGVVTGSYDPNDKTGYPLGVGNDHLIEPNGKMDYVIRFQNTGTDTAFTVVIRDTLNADLDIFSVQSGVASHQYTFKMYGPRVLEWTFDNILLPDSTTNEPASNGFVTFTVNQLAGLPDSTEINNTADIYFDFNPPIITNTTSHIIGREIATPSWTEAINISDTVCVQYDYNGVTYIQSGEYFQVIEGVSTDTLVNLDLTIKTVEVAVTNNDPTISANATGVEYQWLDCGNSYAVIIGEAAQDFTATTNGDYAVEIINNSNGCIDTSACVAITTVGILENTLTDDFVLYPNPTSGEIKIVFESEQEKMKMSLYSISGQLLESKTYQNINEITFEIKDAPGTYLLKLNSGDHEAVIRVVKE
ncbi:MAG: T9SS type A sorting domain-containing protein [Crocinitomicaceae bacterium]